MEYVKGVQVDWLTDVLTLWKRGVELDACTSYHRVQHLQVETPREIAEFIVEGVQCNGHKD